MGRWRRIPPNRTFITVMICRRHNQLYGSKQSPSIMRICVVRDHAPYSLHMSLQRGGDAWIPCQLINQRAASSPHPSATSTTTDSHEGTRPAPSSHVTGNTSPRTPAGQRSGRGTHIPARRRALPYDEDFLSGFGGTHFAKLAFLPYFLDSAPNSCFSRPWYLLSASSMPPSFSGAQSA